MGAVSWHEPILPRSVLLGILELVSWGSDAGDGTGECSGDLPSDRERVAAGMSCP